MGSNEFVFWGNLELKADITSEGWLLSGWLLEIDCFYVDRETRKTQFYLVCYTHLDPFPIPPKAQLYGLRFHEMPSALSPFMSF